MNWTRCTIVVVLFVSWTLIAPTGGVGSASMARAGDISVVSDEDAYLGVELDCNNGTLRVRVTNQFSHGTTMDVVVTVNETTESFDDLRVRQKRTAVFRKPLTGDSVQISASGHATSVQLTRPLPTGC